MKRKSQQELIPRKWYEGVSFGGDLNPIGRRKEKRPLSIIKPMHLVLKANLKIFLSKKSGIHLAVIKMGQRHQIELKDFVIHSNHLHLLIKVSSRENYHKFIRGLSSAVSALFKLSEKLWLKLPWTRILTSKREFLNIQSYFVKNLLEVEIIEWMNRDWKTGYG